MTTESKNNLESDDYDTLLWSAEPVLQSLPSRDIELPNTVAQQKLEKMCVGCFLFCFLTVMTSDLPLSMLKKMLVAG